LLQKKLGVAVGASCSVQLAVVDSQQCRSRYNGKCSVWYNRILKSRRSSEQHKKVLIKIIESYKASFTDNFQIIIVFFILRISRKLQSI